MAFIEETANMGIATTALLRQALPRSVRNRHGLMLGIPVAGNTGARYCEHGSSLFGLGWICLHFNSGW